MEAVERIKAAAGFLQGKLAGRKPEIGIILGSGLGNLADKISDQIVVPYVTVPGFPAATAIGH
ncbi:MAG: purine-nucleoside phosphorylase, partial [Bacteroidales bacterium]|nr:purine-nucleoside phosphorylase [Bacteroidales bacterium]